MKKHNKTPNNFIYTMRAIKIAIRNNSPYLPLVLVWSESSKRYFSLPYCYFADSTGCELCAKFE